VLPALAKATAIKVKGKGKDDGHRMESIVGISLPLVTRRDVAGHRAALVARFPHLVDAIDVILADLAPREVVRLRPAILVGGPGAGKSALARYICKQLGLPYIVYNGGGAADASLAGTPAQWNSARPSVPMQLVRDTLIANPVVIVDEVDKASASRNNGSMFDALLAFLDRGNAAEIRDPALEVTVDLSHVNWILTANSLEEIPAPLRDRCRIVKVPNPGWQHVGDLARSIISDIAKDRDLHENWIAPLDGDELDVVRKAWAGGSIRKLRRVIEVLVDGREQIMARC
jgi:ATP-dependent Lon protease